jgi:hypothetical protein
VTIEQLVCVCFGFIFEALTFALGILVGASLRRKEPNREEQGQGAEGSERY